MPGSTEIIAAQFLPMNKLCSVSYEVPPVAAVQLTTGDRELSIERVE